jgi:heat shock protein HslJ
MRIARIGTGLAVVLFCICLYAQTPAQKMTVTGKLTRVMAIGGESTGWTIELDSEVAVDGKQVHSIEVDSRKIKRLEKLEDKHVEATGLVSHRQGVETGGRMVLDISSIKEAQTGVGASATTASFSLAGSEWLLADLGGAGVIDSIQATLTFPDANKVEGNGSCNRFFGTAKVSGDSIKLGPLGSTRMMCPDAEMNQETKYMNALQAAERFEWSAPYLLIYCKGLEKPLRFTRMAPSKPGIAPYSAQVFSVTLPLPRS